jgi:hypothetical protein
MSAETRLKHHIRCIAVILTLTLGSLVGCVALSMPGTGPCYCDPGPNLGCALADYLHRQHTAFVCGGQARWGRLP